MFWKRRKLKYEIVEKKADDEVDLEIIKRSPFTPTCIRSSLSTALLIALYFAPSIGLTFYQRWLFQEFKFPLSTVLIHLTVKFLLSVLWRTCSACKHGTPRMTIGLKENILSIAPTGIFSGIDIGFSNWGLELITVSLYTMTKSSTIIFILGFAILFKLEKKTWSLCFIVVMISVGLTLFTYKSTQFDVIGFSLVLIASTCSGLRWTCVQLLLQKSKLGMKDPVDMIYFMQPWMFLSVLPFAIWMEGGTVIENTKLFPYQDYTQYLFLLIKVLIGAFIAFFMEMSEVMVVTYTSSLTLSIAGIFKVTYFFNVITSRQEMFILVIAVIWNGDRMSFINVIGLFVCLSGIISHVVHKIRTIQNSHVARFYEYDPDGFESGKALMSNLPGNILLNSDSEGGDQSDTQELFNILNRHDR